MTPREEVRAHILTRRGEFSTKQITKMGQWGTDDVCAGIDVLKRHGAIVKTRRADGPNAWFYRVVNPAFKIIARKPGVKADECLEPWQFAPLLNCFETREGRTWI